MFHNKLLTKKSLNLVALSVYGEHEIVYASFFDWTFDLKF